MNKKKQNVFTSPRYTQTKLTRRKPIAYV